MRYILKTKPYGGLGASFALLLTLFGRPAAAEPAILMDPSICQNQTTSFTYVWKAANVQNLRLFYLSGSTANPGQIHAVGHQDAFDASEEVNVNIHGTVDEVGAYTGQAFAAVFQANHATVPDSVNMYVCRSGTVPQGQNQLSSMARLARAYPGNAGPGSTAIGAMTAPGNIPLPGGCPPLSSGDGNPPVPVDNIAAAVVRTDVEHVQPAHNNIRNALINDWDGNGNVFYPGLQNDVSFRDYCTNQAVQDPTGAWLPAFIDNVNATFGQRYLDLINTNYGGAPLVTCGVGVQCN